MRLWLGHPLLRSVSSDGVISQARCELIFGNVPSPCWCTINGWARVVAPRRSDAWAASEGCFVDISQGALAAQLLRHQSGIG